MAVKFVNAAPGDAVKIGANMRYRATWVAGSLARYLWRGGMVEQNLLALYNGKLYNTGAAYPASSPYINPDGTAGSLDVKVTGAWANRTVSDLARLLESLTDIGVNLELSQLEYVPPATGTAADAASRAGTAAAADEAEKATNPVTKAAATLKTVLIVGGLVLVLYGMYQANALRDVALKPLRGR